MNILRNLMAAITRRRTGGRMPHASTPGEPKLLSLGHIQCEHCRWSQPLVGEWNEQMLAYEMYLHHVQTQHPAPQPKGGSRE